MHANASLAESLASLPERERLEALADLSRGEAEGLLWDWTFWARPNQLPPAGDWLTWLILAGRGFGKTRVGAEWVRTNVCGSTPLGRGRYRQIALIAETAADAREVMVGDGKEAGEGSGILQVHPPDFRPVYEPSKRRLTWPNGAIATLYNAVEPDQLRGPQHDAAWCDELAKWKYAQATWDQLQFGLRVGETPRIVITTTPRPIKLLKAIIAEASTATTYGRTQDNVLNLSPSFLSVVMKRYQGTRLGRQELDAEILEDIPGALWSHALIDGARVAGPPPALKRVVVGVDPSGGDGADNDEVGIVAAGLGHDGQGYILEDGSGKLGPDAWGRRAVAVYYRHDGDRIVAEKNFGGDMVAHVIRTVDPGVPIKLVTASRGKAVRAEPVAALYEQGKVHHVGAHVALEDEMTSWEPLSSTRSPNRVDALVWAISELMLEPPGPKLVFG